MQCPTFAQCRGIFRMRVRPFRGGGSHVELLSRTCNHPLLDKQFDDLVIGQAAAPEDARGPEMPDLRREN